MVSGQVHEFTADFILEFAGASVGAVAGDLNTSAVDLVLLETNLPQPNLGYELVD